MDSLNYMFHAEIVKVIVMNSALWKKNALL